MPDSKQSLSILINKIKTAVYALITLVLASWVTQALNEELIFRMVVRYFYPEETANYVHPFDNIESFLIWFIPALLAVLSVIYTSIITVQHLKKKRIYRLNKSKELQSVDIVILAPHPDNLHQACEVYQNSIRLYFILDKQHCCAMEQEIEAYFSDKQKFMLYELPQQQDLYKLSNGLEKIVEKIREQHPAQDNLAFDLSFSSSIVTNAIIFSLLDNNINLTYFTEKGIMSNHISCSIPD